MDWWSVMPLTKYSRVSQLNEPYQQTVGEAAMRMVDIKGLWHGRLNIYNRDACLG